MTEAAKGLAVSRNTLSMLLNARIGISPEMAIRLSQGFGGSPESWLRSFRTSTERRSSIVPNPFSPQIPKLRAEAPPAGGFRGRIGVLPECELHGDGPD